MKAAFRHFVSRLLEFQTRRLLGRRRFTIVAVGGAVGKTTTKLAIATVLERKYRVLVQEGSFNDEIGLPLACFNIGLPQRIFNPFSWISRLIQMEHIIHRPSPYDVLVIEVGTDAPGEIPHTLTYLHPDISIVTAVTPEHMEFFGDLDTVAKEELALVAGSRQVIVSHDDIAERYRRKYVDPHPKHFYFGLSEQADYGFRMSENEPIEGTTGTLFKQHHARIVGIRFGLFGAPGAKAAVAAYAVADLLGLTNQQIEQGMAALHPVRGRMNPLKGINDSLIIDDTYNATPDAVLAALGALAKVTTNGRRIALLGSMNELGAASPEYHEQIGVAAAGVDLLITLGDQAHRYLGPAALRAGLDPTCYKEADSPYAAGQFLKVVLRPGDVLLAKGSQNGIFAEEALKVLLANPADISQLTRQSPAWLRIKAKQFGPPPQEA